MRWLVPLLLLNGCATVRDHATCANARAAIDLALAATARLCPSATLLPGD